VIDFHEITPVPKAPRFIKGIINLRGEVIPVVDLRERFGLEQAPRTELANIIIVEIAKKSLGLVVDGVSHVLRLAQSEIVSPPPLIGGLSGKYVTGAAQVKDRLVAILNLEQVLGDDEVIQLQHPQPSKRPKKKGRTRRPREKER
jgi:purine-binding chemotaxis protein CheW